jgi:hypothetical protein
VTIDLGRLPTRTLKAGTKLYRVHRKPPWFFDPSDEGRFNPIHVPGRGACCWGEKPIGAFIEAFRTTRTIAESDIASRSVSTIELTRPLLVANLTVKKALAAGVTAALTSGANYDEAHQFASDIQSAFEGVRYRARHDLSQQLISIAWFGPAGDQNANPDLPTPETAPLPDELVDEARSLFGYAVLPSP